MPIIPNEILSFSIPILRTHAGTSKSENERKFKSIFGTNPFNACIIWNRIESIGLLPERSNPEHLLFAFLFLREYVTEELSAILAGCTEKTFRKWIHIFIPLIANLDIV